MLFYEKCNRLCKEVLMGFVDSKFPNWPKDKDDTLYHYEGAGGEYIWERIQEKWPGVTMKDLSFYAEHIMIKSCNCGGYDPTDHANFVCITASKEYMQRAKEEKEKQAAPAA